MCTTIKQKWPNEKRFAVCLTHDVDRVEKRHQYFTRFLHFLRKMKIKYAIREIFGFFKFCSDGDIKKNPYWTFGEIIEIEKKYNVRSTFFFINESSKINILKPITWRLYLNSYSIRHPEIIKIIKRLCSEGWDIGLHGSYNSYKNKKLLKKEKEELENILEKQIHGIRQHYLNLEIPLTWKIHEELGLKYDASFGFRDHVGFKENKHLPFHPFDSSFLVIPLTIMDTALFSCNKNAVEAWEECKKYVDIAEEKNALITILWHQESFNEKEFPEWSKIYEDLIALCKQKNAWIATAGEIELWCNQCSVGI